MEKNMKLVIPECQEEEMLILPVKIKQGMAKPYNKGRVLSPIQRSRKTDDKMKKPASKEKSKEFTYEK